MNKPKLFLDMDNVLVDTLSVLNITDPAPFGVKKPDQIPGIFRHLEPVAGAVEAVEKLSRYFELYILSTSPWENPSAWQDKLLWLAEYFGKDENSPFYKRVILTHDKGLLHGAGGILVDDRPYHGASAWDDTIANSFWLQFGYDERLVWNRELVDFLVEVAKILPNEPSLRRAIQDANKHNYDLHGDREKFEAADWEK